MLRIPYIGMKPIRGVKVNRVIWSIRIQIHRKLRTYAEHTDEDLDGKCDVGGEDFKTYNQLGKLNY